MVAPPPSLANPKPKCQDGADLGVYGHVYGNVYRDLWGYVWGDAWEQAVLAR